MYDKELVFDILKQTLEATEKITRRFEKINNVADFTNSEFGMERLDSICMLLIAHVADSNWREPKKYRQDN